jgi:hypothetical protein
VGGCEAGLGPIADQGALELRQGAEDVGGQLAGRRRRVDRFMQRAQADFLSVKIGDPGDEVLERPAEAVTLRANKSETYWWLKFKLEGAGDLTHGYALTGAAFGGCGVWRDATD